MSSSPITFYQLEQWIHPVAQELARRFAGWRNHYFGFERHDTQFVSSNFDPQVLHYVWQFVETCSANPQHLTVEQLRQNLKEQLSVHPSMVWRARSEAGASDWNPLEQSFDDFNDQFADAETYVATTPAQGASHSAQFDVFFNDCLKNV